MAGNLSLWERFFFIATFLILMVANSKGTKELELEPCSDATTVLVLVHSAPSHKDLRDTFRNTWTSNSEVYRTGFLVGHSSDPTLEKSVLEEASKEGDIIFIDIVDSYRNLTLKHILGYEWAIAKCPKVEYVLKVDDDVFVDTIHLQSYLGYHKFNKKAKEEKFILCLMIEGAKPERDPKGARAKWFMSEEEYPRSDYPPYCSGTAYVTTIETMKIVLEYTKKLPFIFIDDLLVTGLAVEAIYNENVNKEPSKLVELYEWSNVFLHMHTSEEEKLFDKTIGFYSPMLLVAINLNTTQIEILHKKSLICFENQEKCYGQLYFEKTESSLRALEEMTPKKVTRNSDAAVKTEL